MKEKLRVAPGILAENSLCVLCVLRGERKKRGIQPQRAFLADITSATTPHQRTTINHERTCSGAGYTGVAVVIGTSATTLPIRTSATTA